MLSHFGGFLPFRLMVWNFFGHEITQSTRYNAIVSFTNISAPLKKMLSTQQIRSYYLGKYQGFVSCTSVTNTLSVSPVQKKLSLRGRDRLLFEI